LLQILLALKISAAHTWTDNPRQRRNRQTSIASFRAPALVNLSESRFALAIAIATATGKVEPDPSPNHRQ
jgi:hypothetical protein